MSSPLHNHRLLHVVREVRSVERACPYGSLGRRDRSKSLWGSHEACTCETRMLGGGSFASFAQKPEAAGGSAGSSGGLRLPGGVSLSSSKLRSCGHGVTSPAQE